MTITTGDILRLVVSGVWTDGNIVQNVYSCLISGAGGPWDDEDVLDDLEDWADDMYANMTAFTSAFLDGDQVQGYVWDPVGLDYDLFANEPWTWNPSDVGQQIPRGVATFLKAPTTDPDVQGRKYLAGLTEASSAEGLLSAGYIAAMLLYGGDWITPFIGLLTTATFTPGVWSVKNSAFFAFTAEVAAITIPAYQRRRKRGVGI